jgi:hypothetical protein
MIWKKLKAKRYLFLQTNDIYSGFGMMIAWSKRPNKHAQHR